MKFTDVEPMMKNGAKIKLAKWKNAYWYMDEEGCIINHFEEGEEVPAVALFPNDLIWVMRDDWEVVQEPKEEKTYPFGYAISELKNGKKVALEALSFGLAALIVWVLSLCFGFVFSWKLALGLWILFLVAQSIFKPRNNG